MTLRPITILTASEAWGGTELHTWHLACELARRGHPVRIVQLGHCLYDRELPVDGVTIESAAPGRTLDRAAWEQRIGSDTGTLVQVKGGFGIVWPVLDDLIVSSGRHLLRIEHGMPTPRTLRQRWLPPDVRRWSQHRRAATRTLTVAEVVREGLIRHAGYDPQRVAVIGNGVDPLRFRFDPAARIVVRQVWGIAPDSFVFGSIARLAPVKRVDQMLRAFAALPAPEVPSHLVLAGEGPDAEPLRKLASTLGIESRVHWLGLTDQPAEVLAGFDAFLMTSRIESMSYALLEAMAVERPVIAMSVTGVREVMQDRVFGRLTEEDALAFSAAMAEVRAWTPEQRLAAGAAARQQVMRHHDARHQMERVAEWVLGVTVG